MKKQKVIAIICSGIAISSPPIVALSLLTKGDNYHHDSPILVYQGDSTANEASHLYRQGDSITLKATILHEYTANSSEIKWMFHFIPHEGSSEFAVDELPSFISDSKTNIDNLTASVTFSVKTDSIAWRGKLEVWCEYRGQSSNIFIVNNIWIFKESDLMANLDDVYLRDKVDAKMAIQYVKAHAMAPSKVRNQFILADVTWTDMIGTLLGIGENWGYSLGTDGYDKDDFDGWATFVGAKAYHSFTNEMMYYEALYGLAWRILAGVSVGYGELNWRGNAIDGSINYDLEKGTPYIYATNSWVDDGGTKHLNEYCYEDIQRGLQDSNLPGEIYKNTGAPLKLFEKQVFELGFTVGKAFTADEILSGARCGFDINTNNGTSMYIGAATPMISIGHYSKDAGQKDVSLQLANLGFTSNFKWFIPSYYYINDSISMVNSNIDDTYTNNIPIETYLED